MKTWLACFLVVAATLSGAMAGTTNAPRPNLTGRVLTQEGSPLPGASVFIDSAGPKVGRGTL